MNTVTAELTDTDRGSSLQMLYERDLPRVVNSFADLMERRAVARLATRRSLSRAVSQAHDRDRALQRLEAALRRAA